MFPNMITYSAPIDALAFTTATDVFEITPAADRAIVLLGMRLCQTTDLGDANEEVLRIGLYRDATAGSTGTALTEVKYGNDAGTNTVQTAVVANRGTASTGGTLIDIIGWNIRIPLEWFPVPELRPKFSNLAAEGPVSTFRLMAAPADSVTVSGCLYWTEV
jgi:hypothetical protein